MLVLFELPGGYSLFKVGKAGVKLQSWQPFNDAQEAAESVRKLMESKLPETLKQFLNENIVLKELQDELAVADAKLGNTVKQKLGIPCIYDENVEDLMRQIRTQVSELIEELTEENLRQMSVGLAHTLNRHILKFSADKLDIMVIQAIALLDDLDKEINTYVMRAKEWYGWHFPEMGKVITDNIEYAKIVLRMGMRENATKTDFSGILEDESVVQALRDAAIHSMGVVLTNEDLGSIKKLCEEVLASSEYRAELFTYLKNRMTSIAPNLTVMVGELVGARLISHAGSLVKLAKCPASTIQLLGAEKALFKALKSKHETPKYGLLYHVSLVGQASAKNKGRIARLVGTKTALSSRVDAFAENNSEVSIGAECREKVEYTLRLRESGVAFEKAGQRAAAPTPKYDATAEQSKRPREKTRSEWAAATAAPLPGAGGAEEEEEEAPKPKKQRKAAAAAAAAEEEEAPAAEEPKKRKKKAVAAEEE